MIPFISLCMIVKNEEKVLQRCLESVQGLVEEIIIVDTGSIDSTKKIASAYTSQIYNFEWVDDFAAARNYGISQANGKWILILDADEYVMSEKHEELIQFLRSLDPSKPQGITLPIINFEGDLKSGKSMESRSVRIFTRLPGVQYINPIHEQVANNNGPLNNTFFKYFIYHTGYLQETRNEKNKSSRNLAIFEKIISTRKLDVYETFTYANELMIVKDYKKALYYYSKVYQLTKNKEAPWTVHFYVQYINAHLWLDHMKEGYELIKECLRRWPGYPDFHCVLGVLYQMLGFYDEAAAEFQTTLKLADEGAANEQFWLISPQFGSVIPYTQLAGIYKIKQDTRNLVTVYTKVLSMQPQNTIVLYQLMEVLAKNDPAEAVIAFLSQLYPANEPANVLLLLQVSLLLGNRELSEHYFRTCEDLKIPLLPAYSVRYALLCNDRKAFDSALVQVQRPIRENEIASSMQTAAHIWKETSYLDNWDTALETDTRLALKRILSAKNDEVDLPPESLPGLYTVLLDLFKMGYYEDYDKLLSSIAGTFPQIVHQLANHFYAQGYLDLALDYYDNLLSNNSIEASGLENLAYLHINQGLIDDGIQFFKHLIEIKPSSVPSYIQICKIIASNAEKLTYKNKLLDRFPHYQSLPFVRAL